MQLPVNPTRAVFHFVPLLVLLFPSSSHFYTLSCAISDLFWLHLPPFQTQMLRRSVLDANDSCLDASRTDTLPLAEERLLGGVRGYH